MGLMPDWDKMMEEAPTLEVEEGNGIVYIIADSHLGDKRAPANEFFKMLESLPNPGTIVFLGDLFRVWLGLPKFWNRKSKKILKGFQALRDKGVQIIFVVGNREFFLPKSPQRIQRLGLPFDHIFHGAFILKVRNKRIGMSHGDTINRRDINHLRWRWLAHSRGMELFFRALPGPLARVLAGWIEHTLSGTNRAIKIQYPLDEIEAFGSVVLSGLDVFLVGHFHRDEILAIPGQQGIFRIVPDWHGRKALLRLEPSGEFTRLVYHPEEGLREE